MREITRYKNDNSNNKHNKVKKSVLSPDISNFIRELCICRDSGDFSVLTSTEMSQLIEYICTI